MALSHSGHCRLVCTAVVVSLKEHGELVVLINAVMGCIIKLGVSWECSIHLCYSLISAICGWCLQSRISQVYITFPENLVVDKLT